MRLTVIGSSPAWPNPGSAHSGYLLEDGGKLLLDCGPGVLGRLRKAGFAVEAVAITHFHLDHWGDLVPWAWLSTVGPKAARSHPELWVPPGGVEQLARFASFWGNTGMFERAFELREFRPDEPFSAGGFEVEAKRVLHYDLEAYGFRATASGKTVAYSGDAGPTERLAEVARGVDLFLCEATLVNPDADGEPRGHLSADEALAAADGPVLLTHRPVELPPPDGVPLAYDGLVVEVGAPT